MAEGAPLLREYGVYSSIEGSNPSLSAKLSPPPDLHTECRPGGLQSGQIPFGRIKKHTWLVFQIRAWHLAPNYCTIHPAVSVHRAFVLAPFLYFFQIPRFVTHRFRTAHLLIGHGSMRYVLCHCLPCWVYRACYQARDRA